MNKAVELMKRWGEFDEKHPDASIEDFFRYEIAKLSNRPAPVLMVNGIPLTPDSRLMMLIGRIAKVHQVYSAIALDSTGLSQIEEFAILVTIQGHAGDPRKTDVIITNLQELSSGTNMLDRLKKKGLIEEYDDETDRRSKRLQLTAEGQKTLQLSRGLIVRVAKMMMHELDEQDRLLIIQLLQSTEAKFMELMPKQKGKGFDEIYAENMKGEARGV